MNNQNILFKCRYFPLWVILVIGSIGIFSSLLTFSHTELSELFFIESWLQFLSQQSLTTWLMIIFITSLCVLASQAALIITENEICVESFSLRLITFVEKFQVQRLQLYSHEKSNNKLLKPLKQNSSFEDLSQTSTLGISLKPQYRKEYRMPAINLKQIPKKKRALFINVLSNYWGLNPKNISGFDDLIALKFKHKLR